VLHHGTVVVSVNFPVSLSANTTNTFKSRLDKF